MLEQHVDAGRRRDRRLPRGAAHGGDRLRRDAGRRARPHRRVPGEARRTRRASRASPIWRWPAWASTSSARRSCTSSCAATPPTRTRATISARTSSRTWSSTARRWRTASPAPACTVGPARPRPTGATSARSTPTGKPTSTSPTIMPALDLYDQRLADLDLRRDHAAGQVRARRGRPARHGGELAGLRRLHRLRRRACAARCCSPACGSIPTPSSRARWSCPTSTSAARARLTQRGDRPRRAHPRGPGGRRGPGARRQALPPHRAAASA